MTMARVDVDRYAEVMELVREVALGDVGFRAVMMSAGIGYLVGRLGPEGAMERMEMAGVFVDPEVAPVFREKIPTPATVGVDPRVEKVRGALHAATGFDGDGLFDAKKGGFPDNRHVAKDAAVLCLTEAGVTPSELVRFGVIKYAQVSKIIARSRARPDPELIAFPAGEVSWGTLRRVCAEAIEGEAACPEGAGRRRGAACSG